MRILRNKNQAFAVFLMLGFFIGIIYENLISRAYSMSLNIFQDFFLEQYSQMNIVTEDYLSYIVKIRVFVFGGVCLVGCVKWKKGVVAVCLGWTGFLSGIITVQAVLWLGIKGIFLCITAMFPQILFYALAYIILFYYLYDYPQRKWNMRMTVFVISMFIIGIMFEVYLNPLLLQGFIRIFC